MGFRISALIQISTRRIALIGPMILSYQCWRSSNSRAALDAAVATARRKGVSPAQWDDVEVRQLVTTGVDGSGAIGVLAHCRNKRKNVLGSLVL